jgi:hypothetical protein
MNLEEEARKPPGIFSLPEPELSISSSPVAYGSEIISGLTQFQGDLPWARRAILPGLDRIARTRHSPWECCKKLLYKRKLLHKFF